VKEEEHVAEAAAIEPTAQTEAARKLNPTHLTRLPLP